jgi:hypothetical protein
MGVKIKKAAEQRRIFLKVGNKAVITAGRKEGLCKESITPKSCGSMISSLGPFFSKE